MMIPCSMAACIPLATAADCCVLSLLAGLNHPFLDKLDKFILDELIPKHEGLLFASMLMLFDGHRLPRHACAL
jgi:hypothetical protein